MGQSVILLGLTLGRELDVIFRVSYKAINKKLKISTQN